MMIQWHTTLEQAENYISFLSLDGTWQTKFGEYAEQNQQLVHKVKLDNLIPNTEYSFRIGRQPKIYHFKTASEDFDEPYNFLVYSKERDFPSTCRAIARHIAKREMDLFAQNDFYYFPPYPPTTPAKSKESDPYPFCEQDPVRDSCEKTRIAFQRYYSPQLCPDDLAKKAFTAASGYEEKMIFHADQRTDYGGVEKQEAFESYHQQAVFLTAQVLQSFTNPNDFSLYAALHAIGLLRLRAAVKTETGDLLQLGKWRARAPSTSPFEDDPSPYFIVEAITPTPKGTRYHRYHSLLHSLLPTELDVIGIQINLEGENIELSKLWRSGIEHSSAIHTVKIIDYLEKKIRNILGRGQSPPSVLFRDFALIHWWLAQLMPFFRGTASCIEIFIQALAIEKGLPPPRLAGIPKDDPDRWFLFADLEAIFTPLDQYINQYEAMVAKLTLNSF